MPRRPILPPNGQYQGLSSATFRPPPIDGSLGIPDIYDWHAAHSPEHPWFVYMNDAGIRQEITWAEAAAATKLGAMLLNEIVGVSFREGHRRPIVAVLSMSDTITYSTTIVATLRANYVVFPISPRNSPAAIAHLLHLVDVKHLLVGRDASMQDSAREGIRLFKEKHTMREAPGTSTMPCFEDFFRAEWREESKENRKHYIHPEDDTEILFCLHSSGSTAFPKPIFWTSHKIGQLALLPYFGERDLCGRLFAVHVLPVFHAMGALQLFWAATCGMPLAAFAPQHPAVLPTPDKLYAAARAVSGDVIFCVPSFIEAWSRSPDYVKWLASRDGVMFSGGPLNRLVGDMLTAQGVSIFILYGATEVGFMNPILPMAVGKDWNYFQFTPGVTRAEMVPYGNNLYEFIAVESGHMRPAVINTEVEGKVAYASSDLLEPHPTKMGFWRVFGRTDDQIMHNTGEKTNPSPLESLLNQDPHVQASVMFGRGRFQAGILVEPMAAFKFDPSDLRRLQEFRNSIWPTVEAMNNLAPQHSRLFKEMIMIAKPEKPFSYTGKNTPRRQAIIEEYEEEIDILYATVDESTQAGISPPPSWDLGSTIGFVRAVVGQVLSKSDSIDDDDDLFQHGCDSLQATWIRNSLLRALQDSIRFDTRQTTENFVYSYPTIAGSSTFLVALAAGKELETMSKTDEMHALVEKYALKESFGTVKERSFGEGKVVLVTGTTGALGCYTLATLLGDKSVAHVYAVNRSGTEPLQQRQRSALQQRGMDASLVGSNKLTLVVADGYADLPVIVKDVTHVIHNAWRVDFNLGLSSFETNIEGLRDLIILSSTFGARISFISSVSVFGGAPSSAQLEEVAIDASYAEGLGYGASKWVGEELLRRTPGLDYQIIRVGQLSGAVDGSWNIKEWIPAVIQSATVLGCLPDYEGAISWIPIDTAASIIADSLDAAESTYHLAHPNPTRWGAITPALASDLGVKIVPYKEWLAALSTSTASETSLVAKKILPFFRSMTGQSEGNIEAFNLPRMNTLFLEQRYVKPLEEGDVLKWVAYWRRAGLI